MDLKVTNMSKRLHMSVIQTNMPIHIANIYKKKSECFCMQYTILVLHLRDLIPYSVIDSDAGTTLVMHLLVLFLSTLKF